jgi:hypothetical protein
MLLRVCAFLWLGRICTAAACLRSMLNVCQQLVLPATSAATAAGLCDAVNHSCMLLCAHGVQPPALLLVSLPAAGCNMSIVLLVSYSCVLAAARPVSQAIGVCLMFGLAGSI